MIPKAHPLFSAETDEVKIAVLVPNIIALPTPVMILHTINQLPVVASPQSTEKIVNSTIPDINIFFLPYISASLAHGICKIAVVNIYEVGIQLAILALNDNSSLIKGNARLIAEVIKGTRIFARQSIIRT